MRTDLAERIRTIVSSDGFAAEVAAFAKFPEASLLSPTSRAFVDQLVRLQRPTAVLEIGTYYAGTSEIIARALAASGKGILFTIDVLEVREAAVHRAMAHWPEAAREATTFLTVDSLGFFKRISLNPALRFDLAFVDGDHTHGPALMDLIHCARFAANGAVLVVDDYQLPSVNWAVRDFLRLHADWQEISGSFSNGSDSASLGGLAPSIEGTSFLVLLGPERNGIGVRPVSYFHHEFAGEAIAGARLKLAPGHGGGTLSAMFIIDSVGPSSVETSTRMISRPITAQQNELLLTLEPPLDSHYGSQAEKNSCELILSWHGERNGDRLDLLAPPAFDIPLDGDRG